MVFYFTSNASPPETYTIYMGLDKFENEDLIKWGFPEDIWFHVDKLSSAHVYLRLPKGKNIEAIPQDVLIDCAQLVKANSIQGNKMNNITVVYTPWSNLKKTADMDIGQIGFHSDKAVKTVKVEKRRNEIINRLNKTKKELFPDFREEREERDRQDREEAKKHMREQKNREKEEEKRRKEEAALRDYSTLLTEDKMRSNRECISDEDDFM
ncbi:coiled-coil domain-containing protein 25-like [Actinia tenebrosa]|uniref:Coiled-coil domain-containing protein 25 n=1 Tax=Actinia tenebrosa TaxID=6105 RepID=A0A6P8ISY8_ACTTE|nr:coiled-coil domain-containing protein 25-like [Actinia tenebrosa]